MRLPTLACAVFLLAVAAVACGSGNAREHISVRVGGLAVDAEVVRTPEERAQGLSGRDALADGAGMLFVFESEHIASFWMRAMKFPLDIVWIGSDKTVVDISSNVPAPAPGTLESDLPHYSPREPVLYVLEVNAGAAEQAGVAIGDAVSFEPEPDTGATPVARSTPAASSTPVASGTPSVSACATPPGGTPALLEGNLFANPGFEQGKDPWISLDTEAWGTPFAVSSEQAVDGTNSASLTLRSEDGGPARVYGVVQEIAPQDFPEVISGSYCVTRWEKGTPDQYLQLAVIAFSPDNLPAQIGSEANNVQMRYLLAGVDEQPTNVTNAGYVFVSRDEPKVGEWVHFEVDVRQDFADVWGEAPQGFENIRILFEVRWDNRQGSDGPSAADVYYDGLHAGPR
ncbi:MAG: DUF192 domain-containing protein [Dehalococcoidia bacterium]